MTTRSAPDAVGPVYGDRIWQVASARCFHDGRYGHRRGPNERFGELRSATWPRIADGWPGWQRLQAVCKADKPHRAPAAECRCGFYAFKDVEQTRRLLLELLLDELREYATDTAYASRQEAWLVGGRVALWGRIIEGTLGYRAEFAYPAELWVLPPAVFGRAGPVVAAELAADLIRALRSRYGVQVGYAGHSPEWNGLIVEAGLGDFFAWRFSHMGADLLAESMGDIGEPSDRLPTVGDALRLHFPGPGLTKAGAEREIAYRHLDPALGRIPLRRLGERQFAAYRANPPINPIGGGPYGERTVQRHLAVLREALYGARDRGWFVAAAAGSGSGGSASHLAQWLRQHPSQFSGE